MNRSYVASLVGLLALASGAGSVAGCAVPTAAEARGTTSAKLLAPLAVFKGTASASTTAAFGITQWRIYRGKKQFVVTGYDAKGKAVHGAGMSFVQHTATHRAKLQGRIFDGSGFTATHEFGGATEAKALPALSRSFATAAVSDLVQLRQGLKTSITRSAIPTGAACNGDLVKIAIGAMQCIATATTGSTAVTSQRLVAACQAAALSAANAVLSCASVGTIHTPFNTGSSSGSTASSSGSTTGSSGSTTGSSGSTTSSSGATATDQKATDAAQDKAQDAEDAKLEAADAKQDAEQDAADDKQAAADKAQDAQQDKEDDAQTAADAKQDAEQDAADDKGGANADAAASGGACTSCGVGAGDIQANPQNGDVSVADAGDMGGGDMSEALLERPRHLLDRPRHLSREGLSIEFG